MNRRCALPCALLLLAAAPAPSPAQSSIGAFESHSDVGVVLHPGTAEYDAATRTYTVTGSGDNMWAATDAFQFVWKKVSGDVTLTADVAFTGTGGEAHRKGVLMIRQSLDADSAYVDAALHGNGLTSIQARDKKGAITHEVQSYVTAPRRARLQKRGNNFYMFVAGEGEELRPSGGSMQIAFEEPFYVGIGVCAHNQDAVEKVVFSNVALAAGGAAGKPTLYSTLEVVRLAAATDHRAVVVSPGRIESPTWARDGASLIFRQDGKTQRVAADGGKPEPVDAGLAVPANGSRSASPDGQYIYFSSDRAGSAQIWRTKPDGSEPEQVTSDGSNNWFPHVSPDGQRLAFLSYEKSVAGHPADKEVELRIMTLSTKRVDVLARMLGGQGTMDAPMWSPDSRRIAFVSYQLIPK